MKKLIICIMGLSLSACSQIDNPLKLDTLMSKKIEINMNLLPSEYSGIISLDTIKDLSINAVNTYFINNLKVEDADITAQFYESETMENMILKWGHKPYGFLLPNEITEELTEALSDGIFFVTINGDSFKYEVIIGANSGKIFGLNTWKEAGFTKDERVSIEELLSACDIYIEDVMGINPETLDVEIKTPKYSNNYELHYYDKITKEPSFLLEVNPYNKKVIRLSFESWALLT